MSNTLIPIARRGFASRLLALTSLLICCLISLSSPAHAKTAMQTYVEAMQPGWNLGNTLDATPTETSWGNPPVTQELIQQIAAQGFKSIRIPITWADHMGPGPDYTVDPAWMDRTQQIVDWSLAAGLYVMINVHHDSGRWVAAMSTDHDNVLARYEALWSQIALRFRDHSPKLMFESINEPYFNANEETQIALLEELNLSFATLVRSTGGGNATRPLVLPSLATNHAQNRLDSLANTLAQLNDSNLIATIHYYGFWPFSVNIAGYTTFESASLNDLRAAIDGVYNTFVSKGVPVVLGEYGLLAFDTSNGAAIERGELLKFFETFTSYAREKGVTHQWWDNGQHFNRSTYQWRDPELYGYIMHSRVGRSSTANTDLIFLKSGSPVQDAVITLNLNGNTFLSLQDGAKTLMPGVDYTRNGNKLTVKATALAGYASGGFGEKTVLTANFSAGQPWKLRVRHQATPVFSAASGTKAGGIVIPVAFNGDLVATMEARYVAGGNAGPHNWTSFKEYQQTYRPNYTNNALALTKEFFAEMTGDQPIDLTFHFWSGKVINYRLAFEAGGGGGGAQERIIYDNSLAFGWGNWSWASVNDSSEELAYSAPRSMAVDAGGWAAVFLGYSGAPMTEVAYRTLTFWANGGVTGNQRITVSASENWNFNLPSVTLDPLPANTWKKFEVSLDAIGVTTSANITTFTFQNASGEQAPRFHLDEIRLTTAYASSIVFVQGTPNPVGNAAIARGGLVRDRRTGYYVQQITVTNNGPGALTGPFYLAIDALSPNATLVAATGNTANYAPLGSPYVLVTDGSLAPGASATVKLQFTNPSNSAITYTARIFNGVLAP